MKSCIFCDHYPGYKAFVGHDGDVEEDVCACCLESFHSQPQDALANECVEQPTLCQECGIGAGKNRTSRCHPTI